MKFLFVGNTAWTMWNFRGEVMIALKNAGHEVVVASPADAGCEILRAHFRFEEIKVLNRKSENPLHDLMLCYELFRIYRRVQPELIFHYTIKPNIYGGLASFFCGIKSCMVVAGMGYAFGRATRLRKIVTLLYRLAAHCSSRIIFLNQDDWEDFRFFKIIDSQSGKPVLFPGEGVDMHKFSPEISCEKFEADTTFIFVGRLLVDKGIREFLNAARVIRRDHARVRFQVLGPVDRGNPMTISAEDLQEYIDDGSVEYAGETDDVRPFIRAAGALVLPTRYGEGLSRVILEALAMGKPVIATDNRGCRPLVFDGITGLVVPEKRLSDLPFVLKRFLEMDERDRRVLGENGRKLVTKEFSMSKVISLYQQLINEIINHSAKQRLAKPS